MDGVEVPGSLKVWAIKCLDSARMNNMFLILQTTYLCYIVVVIFLLYA